MNANEPVAWMELYYGEPNNIAWTNTELKDSGEIYKTVPLYTHPAKTYEDAIEECAQRAEAYAYMSSNFTALAEELRAILKKASE